MLNSSHLLRASYALRPQQSLENYAGMNLIHLFLLISCVLAASCSNPEAEWGQRNQDSAANYTIPLLELRVQPSDTGAGIDSESLTQQYHHVVFPQHADHRKNILLIHLVGTAVSPNSALDISRFAASLGYSVLNLRYINRTVVDVVCGERLECPEQFRGESVFGEAVAYSPQTFSYDESANVVSRQNSIVNRVISLLDYLSTQAPTDENPQPAMWKQFLSADSSSPYVATHAGNVYPNWQKIILSGHSQGGGMVAMLAMNLPARTAPKRVILLAAPNDNTGDRRGNEPSPWLVKNSSTPLQNYWGLRHADDSNLGDWVQQNWQNLGGRLRGGVGGSNNPQEVDIGDGSGNPQGAQRLLLSQNTGSTADAHSSPVDRRILPAVARAWEYLFTGNGQD